MVSVAVPRLVSKGACALISVELTKTSGAARPLMVTAVPLREFGRGMAIAVASLAARFVPRIEIKEPGAMDGSRLAVFTIAVVEGSGSVTARVSRFEIAPGIATAMVTVPAAGAQLAGDQAGTGEHPK